MKLTEKLNIGVKDFNIPKDTVPLIAISFGESLSDVRLIFSKQIMEISKQHPKDCKQIESELPQILRDIADCLDKETAQRQD